MVTDDGKYVHLFPQEGTSSTPWFYAKLELPVTDAVEFEPIVEEPTDEFYFVTSDDNLVYMRTNRNAQKFRLVRVDINNPAEENWVNILPEDDDSVLDNVVAVNKDYLAAIYMRDVVHIIQNPSVEGRQTLVGRGHTRRYCQLDFSQKGRKVTIL